MVTATDSAAVVLDTAEVWPETGHCYLARIPAGTAGVLYEDSKALEGEASHEEIRTRGRGRYSFWHDHLYFSSSDNTDPRSNGRRYSFDPLASLPQPPLFRRLLHMRAHLSDSPLVGWDPAGSGLSEADRMRLLEAKVEYLLDELYAAKSLLRHLTPTAEPIRRLAEHQKKSFDYQWRTQPYHDEFLTNPEWKEKAHLDVARRVGQPAEWFKGKKILDCGCGPGRHTYAFAQLGASVVAFDTSATAIERVRQIGREFPGQVEVFPHDILAPIPAPADFDLVWCYGVVQHTGHAFATLENIARHVRPGGWMYVMVYAEPRRDCVHDYTYYHEIYALRQALLGVPLPGRAAAAREVEGERNALAWFDAISSEINDLFTTEELFRMLSYLGFEDAARTMPHETMQNVVARKRAA
jgi:SAM-dependent methyltransferase